MAEGKKQAKERILGPIQETSWNGEVLHEEEKVKLVLVRAPRMCVIRNAALVKTVDKMKFQLRESECWLVCRAATIKGRQQLIRRLGRTAIPEGARSGTIKAVDRVNELA